MTDLKSYFRQESRNLLKQQCLVELDDVDMAFGAYFKMPSNAFWCIRLGTVIARFVGCTFSFSNPKQGQTVYGSSGRFFGTAYDVDVAKRAYRKYGMIIIKLAKENDDRGMPPRLVSMLSSSMYEADTKVHRHKGIEPHVYRLTRRRDKSNVDMFRCLHEAKAKR